MDEYTKDSNISLQSVGVAFIHAAKNYRWNIHGKTLSNRQLEYCMTRLREQRLEQKISIEYQDFTSINSAQMYDGAVMIEALEHVGKDNLETFLLNIRDHLSSNAPLYVQFTGRYTPKRVDPWTLRYVFPGGHLPAKSEFLDAVSAAGLLVERFEDHTDDYKKTMAAWIRALEEHETDLVAMFGRSFFRLWKLWTHGAYVNFNIGDMSLFRVLLRKP
jgi:cyclopropane-fatty-acyl-phospholipid synthase